MSQSGPPLVMRKVLSLQLTLLGPGQDQIGKELSAYFSGGERGHSQGAQPRPGQAPGAQMSWKHLLY